LDRGQYERLRSRITVDVFTHELHLLVAKTLDVLYRTGSDFAPVTILSEIDRDDAASAKFRGSGGVDLLGELTIAGVPSKAAPSYLKILEESAQKRSILRATDELAHMAKNGADSSDLARIFQTYSRRMETLLAAEDHEVTLAEPSVGYPWDGRKRC
jgi:replicative DNA helicase